MEARIRLHDGKLATADLSRLDDVLHYKRDWRFSRAASAPREARAAERRAKKLEEKARLIEEQARKKAEAELEAAKKAERQEALAAEQKAVLKNPGGAFVNRSLAFLGNPLRTFIRDLRLPIPHELAERLQGRIGKIRLVKHRADEAGISEIRSLERVKAMPDVEVFHAGTAWRDGKLVANGGRVLNITARARTVTSAIARFMPWRPHSGRPRWMHSRPASP